MQPDPPQVELQMLLLSEHPLKVRRRALQANMVGSNNHGVYIFCESGFSQVPILLSQPLYHFHSASEFSSTYLPNVLRSYWAYLGIFPSVSWVLQCSQYQCLFVTSYFLFPVAVDAHVFFSTGNRTSRRILHVDRTSRGSFYLES